MLETSPASAASSFRVYGAVAVGSGDVLSRPLGGERGDTGKGSPTLVLLLLTSLHNSEIVLGKLLAGLLNIGVLILASLPVFMLCLLFGSISVEQILRVFAVTFATTLATGSLGAVFAFWRKRPFKHWPCRCSPLSFVALGEAVAWGLFGDQWLEIPSSSWAAAISPSRQRSWLHDRYFRMKSSSALYEVRSLPM